MAKQLERSDDRRGQNCAEDAGQRRAHEQTDDDDDRVQVECPADDARHEQMVLQLLDDDHQPQNDQRVLPRL